MGTEHLRRGALYIHTLIITTTLLSTYGLFAAKEFRQLHSAL